jgi:hypothetical protein
MCLSKYDVSESVGTLYSAYAAAHLTDRPAGLPALNV